MLKYGGKCLLITLFFFGCLSSFAQTTASSGTNTSNPLSERENNPYSKYGIGELQNGNSVVLKGMGNVTTAFENAYEINSDNPASYSFLKRTTFEIGGTGSSRTVSSSDQSFTTGTATLSYLAIGIPVGRHAGISFGFRPYAHTYYSLVDTIFTPASPIGQAVRSYNGDGSINYAYIGAAYQYKGLSLGANFGYMFGTLSTGTNVVPDDTNTFNRGYIAEFNNYNRIGGIYWKGGLLYERKIDSNYTIRVGGTITISQQLKEQQNTYRVSVYNFGDTLVNDTSYNSVGAHGKLTLPLSYALGVSLSKNEKWSLGIDYTGTQWSGFRSTPDATLAIGVGSQAYKFSLGGELTPDANNIRNYLSRVTYRMGLYYGVDYINIDNTSLPVYGLTLGASLPFRRSFSHLHTSLDIGRLGTMTNGLIQETYVRFSLGVSFNDLWFIKRRYD